MQAAKITRGFRTVLGPLAGLRSSAYVDQRAPRRLPRLLFLGGTIDSGTVLRLPDDGLRPKVPGLRGPSCSVCVSFSCCAAY